jgi:hypothetical protein
MKCPDCHGEMELVDKTTFTGREIREYFCTPCQKSIVEHGGIALWQALSEAREAAEQDPPPAEKKK